MESEAQFRLELRPPWDAAQFREERHPAIARPLAPGADSLRDRRARASLR